METFSEEAKPGAAIVNGDQIKIGDEGYAAVIYIDDRSIIKIKANLQLRTEVCYSNKPHIDHKFPNALTGIYYVNDNDGYTVVGETKVESKRGRIVIFPSDTYHYGTSSHQDRCVININYFPQYNEY